MSFHLHHEHFSCEPNEIINCDTGLSCLQPSCLNHIALDILSVVITALKEYGMKKMPEYIRIIQRTVSKKDSALYAESFLLCVRLEGN